MTTYRVLPYKAGSRSARALSRALGGKTLLLQGRDYHPGKDEVLINWGNSNPPARVGSANFLNRPSEITTASNKLVFFRQMWWAAPDLVPEFWTDPTGFADRDFPIVCRTVLDGHSGRGIVIADHEGQLVKAPLYVKYEDKQQEYRIHVGKLPGRFPSIIAVQRKARKKDVPDNQVNWRVRNHDNGFVFVRKDVKAPVEVLDIARRALNATALDFGAVDVIWNERKNRAFVLEVNTAPGLEGATIDDYVRYFTRVGSANRNEGR